MPPIIYEKSPPTANDVKLAPAFISALSNESDEDIVVHTVAQEDAFRFAKDIERNSNGNINLNEVRRGLTRAAEALTDPITRSAYVSGVDRFIELQLGSTSTD